MGVGIPKIGMIRITLVYARFSKHLNFLFIPILCRVYQAAKRQGVWTISISTVRIHYTGDKKLSTRSWQGYGKHMKASHNFCSLVNPWMMTGPSKNSLLTSSNLAVFNQPFQISVSVHTIFGLLLVMVFFNLFRKPLKPESNSAYIYIHNPYMIYPLRLILFRNWKSINYI